MFPTSRVIASILAIPVLFFSSVTYGGGKTVGSSKSNVGLGTGAIATLVDELDISGPLDLPSGCKRNTGLGFNALKKLTTEKISCENTAVGANAMIETTTGGLNTAVGSSALHGNLTGSKNVAIGYQALQNNLDAELNTAIGTFSLNQNTTGEKNTALGSSALYENVMGNENVAIGYSALLKNVGGEMNTAIGTHALADNLAGKRNTAVGSFALRTNKGFDDNTAIGFEALRDMETGGGKHTALGSGALRFLKTGGANTALGYRALHMATLSSKNTATGVHSLFNNQKGNKNTATGYMALAKNFKGDHNTAIGAAALQSNNGSQNSAVGTQALFANKAGADNTAIGFRAGGHNVSGSKNIFIGYRAGDSAQYKDVSNTLVISNGSRGTQPLIVGDFAKSRFRVNGVITANELTKISDARVKQNVSNIKNPLEKILKLGGKTYTAISTNGETSPTPTGQLDFGLIAQEVESVLPELVSTGKNGYKSVAYLKVIPILIEAIKAQQQQIEDLQSQNISLQESLDERVVNLVSTLLLQDSKTVASN